jgi:hypothetical protein
MASSPQQLTRMRCVSVLRVENVNRLPIHECPPQSPQENFPPAEVLIPSDTHHPNNLARHWDVLGRLPPLCHTITPSAINSRNTNHFPITTNRKTLAQVDARTIRANAQSQHHATSAAQPTSDSLLQAPAASYQDPYKFGHKALYPPQRVETLQVAGAPMLRTRELFPAGALQHV